MSILDIFSYKNRVRYLESEVSILDSKLKSSETEIEKKNEIFNQQRTELGTLRSDFEQLQKHCADLETFINSRLPSFDCNSITDRETFESLQNTWANTLKAADDDLYASARQTRACYACYTPLDLDADSGTGHFRGTDSDYQTTLKSCTCMDFQRRAFPCKHMYRLAHELGIFMLEGVEYVSNPKRLLFRSEFIKILSSLLETSRDIFGSFQYAPVIAGASSSLQPLLKSGLVQVSPCKRCLLDYYKRDELLSFLPDDADVKKNIKKSDLIELIIADYPDIICQLEKFALAIELSPHIKHFVIS